MHRVESEKIKQEKAFPISEFEKESKKRDLQDEFIELHEVCWQKDH